MRYHAMHFFSEICPCGALGSFILDKLPAEEDRLTFKHHYITHAPDSDILCSLLLAIGDKRAVILHNKGKRSRELSESTVIPLKIYAGTQNGRQYLIAYHTVAAQYNTYRIDYIKKVSHSEPCPRFDQLAKTLTEYEKHIWGVNIITVKGKPRLERVEFTVRVLPNEEHIVQRLRREKRCGTLERISPDTWRFTAEIFDTYEMVPWIRTFICRITSLSFSNKALEKKFREDIIETARAYGLEIPDSTAADTK